MLGVYSWCTILLCLFVSISAEVGNDCNEVYYKEAREYAVQHFLYRVDLTRFKFICQPSSNRYYFTTLYDTQYRIPVYSAYNIKIGNAKRKYFSWQTEPDLPEQDQAVLDDYTTDRTYHKGHLNPVNHNTYNINAIKATFTLTNAVPQYHNMNQGIWQRVEYWIGTHCSSGRVTTGAVPGVKWLNNRVNIPSYMWSYVTCGGQSLGFVVPNINNDDAKNLCEKDSNNQTFHLRLESLYSGAPNNQLFDKCGIYASDRNQPQNEQQQQNVNMGEEREREREQPY